MGWIDNMDLGMMFGGKPGSQSMPSWVTPPSAGSMNSMALVEMTNPTTGETWTAPSGGYSLAPTAPSNAGFDVSPGTGGMSRFMDMPDVINDTPVIGKGGNEAPAPVDQQWTDWMMDTYGKTQGFMDTADIGLDGMSTSQRRRDTEYKNYLATQQPAIPNTGGYADPARDFMPRPPSDAPLRGFEGVAMTPEQSPPTQDVLGITEQDSNSLAAPLQASPTQQPTQQPIQQPIQPVVSPLHRQQPLQVTQAPQIMQGIGALQSPTQAYNSTQPMHQAPLQDRQQSTGFGLSNPGTSYHTGLSQTPSSSPLYAQQDQEAQSVFTGPEQGSKAWWLR